MNGIISRILKTNSWKIGALSMILGFPIRFIHIIQLQKAGMADDLGLWYRIYCAVVDVAPYAIGVTVIHILLRKYRRNKA
jgi:hypothetical protein